MAKFGFPYCRAAVPVTWEQSKMFGESFLVRTRGNAERAGWEGRAWPGLLLARQEWILG